MKCPKCHQEMEVKSKDTSNNFETGQKYERTIFQCKEDDVWVTTEIPKKGK